MADAVTLATKIWRLGAKRYYRYRCSEEGGIDISTATATIEIYDSAGSTVLAATAMTMAFSDSNRKGVAKYFVTTGAGQLITAAGDYRVVIRHTFAGETQVVQGALTILAVPE